MSRISTRALGGALTAWRLEAADQALELVPARGGLVTRWEVHGEEVLYLEEATLLDFTRNVRGGIPQLFPSPGRPAPGSALPQHGFARQRPFTPVEAPGDALACELSSDDATRAAFPHDFRLRFEASLSPAGLHLGWTVANPGPAPLPLHLGIHPYFRVPVPNKAAARVDHTASSCFDNVAGHPVPVGPVDFSGPEVDLHLEGLSTTAALFHRGAGRPLRLAWTPHFRVLVLWTQPGKDFICVEPWTARGGAVTTGQGLLHVAPGAAEVLGIDLALV
jgi:galactose mutarotase-like enzyme